MAAIGKILWRTAGSLFGNDRSSVLCHRTFVAIYQPLTKEKSAAHELQQPAKPKKPKNQFILYVQECLPKTKITHPTLSVTERVRNISQAWRSLSSQEKSKYMSLFQEDQLRYQEQLKVYKDTVPEESRNAKKDDKADKEMRERRVLKKKLLSMGMPKRPLNAYMLFVMENLNAEDLQAISHTKRRSILGSKWRELSKDEQAKYKAIAEANRQSYPSTLLNWEAEMVKEGKLDIQVLIKKANPKVNAEKK